MATYKIVNTFHATSGIVADDVSNVFHYATTEGSHDPATAGILAGHVAAAYEEDDAANGLRSVATYISGEMSRVLVPTLKVYNPAGGSPLWVGDWAGFSAPDTAAALPSEVSCCLSYRGDLTDVPEEAVDDADADAAPERPASRRRGRIYVGPLTTAASDGNAPSKPVAAFRNSLLYFAQRLFSTSLLAGSAQNADWVVRSSSGFAGGVEPIVDAWVDDAWDTQRRRGRNATQRYFASI